MAKTRFQYRHQYDDEADAKERAATDIHCCDESLTQQHFTQDADINVMVKRFGITDGAIPPAAIDPQHFGDFTDAVDFRTALDRTRDAQERFAALPANLRSRFNNDPVELWDFVTTPANEDEAVKLGLLSRREDTNPPKPPENQAPSA